MLCIGTYYLPGSTKGNKKKSNKDMYTYYKKSVNLLTNMITIVQLRPKQFLYE